MGDTFHLAYIPAAGSGVAVGDDNDVSGKKISKSDDDDGDDDNLITSQIIVVQRATSLRLYRCRSSSEHQTYTCGSDEQKYDEDSDCAATDNNLGHHQQQNENCRCCCCRVDSLSSSTLHDAKSGVNNIICTAGKNMLAVLVPSSLTRGLINIVEQNDSISKNNSKQQQLVSDAEIELRKSIHQCLCLDNNGLKSNENDNDNNSHLSVRGIITSNRIEDCTNFPADVVLLGHNTMQQQNYARHQPNCNIHENDQLIPHYSSLLNHDTASKAPWSVLKAFPVSTISALPVTTDTNKQTILSLDAKEFDVASLPCCPVCLNLIEPSRLGLPDLKPHHKCSRWCLNSNELHGNQNCVNEKLLLPWPPPSQCNACQAIAKRERSVMESITNGFQRSMSLGSPLTLSPSATQRRIMQTTNEQQGENNGRSSLAAPLLRSMSHISTTTPSQHSNSCHECGMSTTLWVCLTCGVVGCGRYTQKHAAQHYAIEGHPYSLELATGRIWDYDNGKFVHRRDLLECPVLSMKWGIAVAGGVGECPSSPVALNASSLSGGSYYGEGNSSFSDNDMNHAGLRKEQSNGLDSLHVDGIFGDDSISCHHHNQHHKASVASRLSAPPKKSMVLSQEYEALLQSALEDQSQHYEGEIARLRADLALSLIEETKLSDRESREIDALKRDSDRLKHEVEELSSILLTAQTSETMHRSISQRLLREQSISKELLDRLQNEIAREHENGKLRTEDLEMQITDLAANIRMMQEFAENEELSQAQIVGTIGGEQEGNNKKQRGKKNRRGKKR